MSSDDKESTTQVDAEATSAETPEAVQADEPDADPAPETGTAPAQSQRARGGAFGAVVLFVLIGLLGAGGYYWQQNVYQRDLATLAQQIAALDGAQSAVQADIESTASTAETAAAAAKSDIGALRAKIDSAASAQGDLQRSVSALYEKETQTSVDWILSEAEYLVFAATQRLALERDIDTAEAALRAADQRLRSAEHPDLIPIRDQLIQDITALEAVNLPDVEGLAIYLAKTIAQVEALPTKPIAQEVTPFDTVRGGEYKAEDWRRLAYAVWSDLVDLVEVKDADLPDSVLFDPELRYFLQQNLKLELASARLSVLRRDRANLEASTDLIKRLLDAYYDVDDAGVAAIVGRLDDAAAIEFAPALPNIAGSLDVIRKHRESRVATVGAAQ